MARARGRKSSITTTKNYDLFTLSDENRNVDLSRHRRLKESMQKYGFLSCFPIACTRNGVSALVVKDGQHRLEIAKELGLPVPYVIEDQDFDVAEVNCTSKPWTIRDYVEKHATNGNAEYIKAMQFAEEYDVPIGWAFGLLSGTASVGNVMRQIQEGTWKSKDRDFALDVATLYAALCTYAPRIKNARLLWACYAVTVTPGFDRKRMMRCADKQREKLVPYSTRDAYLQMLEDIYNHGQRKLVGLRAAALQAMKQRNAISNATAAKQRNSTSK